MFDWLLRKLFKHVDIIKTVDGQQVVYLRRYFIWKGKDGSRINIHHIRRSDDDPDPHDHPWDFSTLVFWGGYDDESYRMREGLRRRDVDDRLGFLSFRRRPAEHIHQVRLNRHKSAWTLVKLGPLRRDWGFVKDVGWMYWRTYLNFWEPDPFDP